MKIKKWGDFLLEISGTELVGPIGPAYGETRLQNKTVNFHNTNVIFCNIDRKIYTIDEWNDLYNQYLSKGGSPLPDGFNSENLDTIVNYLESL
jgi:hypothetical protein